MTIQHLSSLAWRFRKHGRSSTRWLPALVPGCVHTDLLRAGLIPDPLYGQNERAVQWIEESAWDYEVVFDAAPELLAHEVVELVADGLDTVATISLNGITIGRSENMYVGHRWAARHALRHGRNVLRILFHSPLDYIRTCRDFSPPQEFCDPVGNCVRIRKQPCQFGWDWAPRLVTCGIWRDVRLEAWSGNRLSDLRVTQHHRSGGKHVSLAVTPEFAKPAEVRGIAVSAVLLFAGRVVVETASDLADATASLSFSVPHPRLWWPAGQGEQALYDLVVTAQTHDGQALGKIRRRIGLRTVVLDRSPDRWGECFRFVVNGRPVFLKGANWVPASVFVHGLSRVDYERDLRAAAAAHMNSLRVWGGGIYEHEAFYDLCDELGLLVWQDFMFACTLYPSDDAFLSSVREEADYQVKRLRHRACLALWCGNNELVQINGEALRSDATLRSGYEKLFHGALVDSVATHDGVTTYWPSTEWRETFENGIEIGEKKGDSHFWDVWFRRAPLKSVERWDLRLCSEFGLQSFSSPETNARACPPGEDNLFGPVMEWHQRSARGNSVILDYVVRRYRFPRDQRALITLSQLTQAAFLQIAVEHFRRLTPRCMGSLYWQLNDCWPVTSWSSIEHGGRWKAAHYLARRFHAPALVSVHLPGKESVGLANRLQLTHDTAHLYTVYDAPKPARGTLRWKVFTVDDGRVHVHGQKSVALRTGASVRQTTLKLASLLVAHGRERLALRYALEIDGATVSGDTLFFTEPRFIPLPRGSARASIRLLKPDRRGAARAVELTFQTSVFLHRFHFDFEGVEFSADDNFFDLYPDEPRCVRVELSVPMPKTGLVRCLRLASVVDLFA